MNLVQPEIYTQINKTKTMQAATLVAPGKFELQTIKIAEPGADEVLIRLEECGLCASNVPPWEGRDWFTYPMEPGGLGHEGWGIAEVVGKEVKNISPGDRVTALSYHAYAEYDVAKVSQVVKLPDSLEGKPFPGEPLGCAMNIFRRSDIQPGMTVAIVGIGFLGALLVQLAKGAGARVIALSRRHSTLDIAKAMGADEVLPLEDHWQVIEQVKALTEGKFCERVIEATGKQWPLDLAGEITAERGKLIVAGFHQDGLRQVNMQLWNWRGIDVINAHERAPEVYMQGIQQAVEAVVEGRLNPFPLFTHVFPKEQIQEAFQLQHQKPEGFIKALITFN
jgi:threonine dehydrogenase-like Zn-dependent dehydrogenase